jgi:hypothetical protein
MGMIDGWIGWMDDDAIGRSLTSRIGKVPNLWTRSENNGNWHKWQRENKQRKSGE